eukprot:CAMPEP_0181233274 /NCGR_PEP_ID=MMETSP1096-20121128/36240_1 /TAXON_ID=156174 ORGANISM="Chrysochromulina ericina, Strain CCMP281" /NCGR_SAMPLE_ID=MMETSP1096 /ASSEMBLY_ACC=CAM_ASM_000453 /LENGTH=44 /DNA_ID= /DNA_START= /DNA_END= /DNA_ORIENTATION=
MQLVFRSSEELHGRSSRTRDPSARDPVREGAIDSRVGGGRFDGV